MNHTFPLNLSFPIIRGFPLKLKFNLKFFLILSFILIISLFALYIFQINYLTSGNYQIKKSQEKIRELSEENQNLEIQLAKISSLASIENLIENFDFVKVDKIHYIQILENQIVKE